jgi:peptidoglycan hydrolase-like protein with peptidoglycan-binding domain
MPIAPDLSLPYDGYYEYRALRLVDGERMHGADVYALQTGLKLEGRTIQCDGIFGPSTSHVVRNYQAARGLTQDGIAGYATQREIARHQANKLGKAEGLPIGIPLGHVENESGYLLGNYTARYPNGTRDEGVVQRNTAYAKPADAFDVKNSLHVIVNRIRDYHAKYVSWGVEFPRSWRLACGAWNAPAWTDTLARGGTLSSDNYAWISAYIDRVTAYAAAGGWHVP